MFGRFGEAYKVPLW